MQIEQAFDISLEDPFQWRGGTFCALKRGRLQFPSKICIVAPGPNGKMYYDKIPSSYAVIVVNKAVLIEGLSPICWLIAHAEPDWFERADQFFLGLKIIERGAIEELESTQKKVQNQLYYFYSLDNEILPEDDESPLKKSIQRGATVSAQAVQLAYQMGATDILLCGVDMSGNQYWDETENNDPIARELHGMQWDSVKRFNPLIKKLIRNGVNVRSLSPTQLEVPQYQPLNIN